MLRGASGPPFSMQDIMLADRYPQLEKSVFIVTYGRSGSTLVQNMLNSLPGALVRGENDNLLAPLVRAWEIVRSSEQIARMRRSGKVTQPSDPWFGYEGVTPERLGQALARSFAETVLRPAPDTRITGFKEIRWHREPDLFAAMIEFLHLHFPGARVVFNFREHAAVMRSGWWSRMDPAVVRGELERAEALYVDYVDRHPGRCLTLRYEEYTRDVDAWRPLFDFLGEPFDAARAAEVMGQQLTHLRGMAAARRRPKPPVEPSSGPGPDSGGAGPG